MSVLKPIFLLRNDRITPVEWNRTLYEQQCRFLECFIETGMSWSYDIHDRWYIKSNFISFVVITLIFFNEIIDWTTVSSTVLINDFLCVIWKISIYNFNCRLPLKSSTTEPKTNKVNAKYIVVYACLRVIRSHYIVSLFVIHLVSTWEDTCLEMKSLE